MVIVELSDAQVAVIAEQATNFAGVMIVIDLKVWRISTWQYCATYSATTILSVQQRLVVGYGKTVMAFEFTTPVIELLIFTKTVIDTLLTP